VTTSHSSPALISTGSDSEKSSLLIRLSNDRLKAPQGILLKGDHLCEHRCDTTPNLGHVPMSQYRQRRMSTDEKERLRTRLHDHLATDANGRIIYESFANAVKGRVR
jgi:hypothetical protein